MSAVTLAGRAAWLAKPDLQAILAALSRDGDLARVAGGAVRNALLGEPVGDVDIATTTTPDETGRRMAAIGLRTVPTGREHGTVTVIAGSGRTFEVTTLREDVETDGRHARVVFGRDWQRDAERRDFTINALYAEADGSVIDLVGGLADLDRRILRFIGDADARIAEDYLRILRFFRFFAWYGAGRPDADGLRACARMKGGLAGLSAERVWKELRRLLEAPDPSRALLWMRQTSVLSTIMPESEKWGIDAIPALVTAERGFGWSPDPLLRLAAIVPPDAARMEAMARRLRFSKAEAARLTAWAMAQDIAPASPERQFLSELYFADRQAVLDRLRLALARLPDAAVLEDRAALSARLHLAQSWQKPAFPLNGRDLQSIGVKPGPELGRLIGRIERDWAKNGFEEGRDALLARAASLSGTK